MQVVSLIASQLPRGREPKARRDEPVPSPRSDDPVALLDSRGGLHVPFVSVGPDSLREPTRELVNEPVREHVRHSQDLDVDAVVRADVR